MRRAPKYLLILTLALAGCDRSPDKGPVLEQTESLAPAGLRIVTLAPHLAELVFAIGAGDLLVGVTAYTDYPPAAAALPQVGDAFAVDLEELGILGPDLLLAWESGTAAHVIDELRRRGYRIENIETRGIDDIAAALVRIGSLTGHEKQAASAAAVFSAGIGALAERYRKASPISVFFQVSSRPLYTVNGDHYVSDLIEICGGRNIFDDLNSLAPLVDVEAVLSRNPEAMLASDDNLDDAFTVWQRWPELAAARYGNFFFLPADEIGRATPRLLQAGETLCAALDSARRNRINPRSDSDPRLSRIRTPHVPGAAQ